MELWIALSIAAALSQTVRFAVQKVLADGSLSPVAATWARFIWSAPIIAVAVMTYALMRQLPFPRMGSEFLPFALLGGLTQILATICTIALFRRRAFSVGITFKKSEVMLTALTGLAVLGDTISPSGAVFIGLGFVGVLLLSEPPEGGSMFNAGATLGLASGAFFAVSAVAYRGATLSVESTDTFFVAGITLSIVTAAQAIGLGVWLRLFEPGQISATLSGWRKSALVGIFSLLGSWCWFAAFSLQNAAYVFAVGQIELIFSLLIGALLFSERPSIREFFGMVILTISIVAVALIGSS